jgi:uncharacterized membrane protein (UPF0127 family)
MKIFNSTRKTVVAENVEVAVSFFKKSLGLMFRKNIPSSRGFLMEFSREGQGLHSIWMLGMRFPIDVLFLDSKKRVVDVFENVPPLSLHPRTWKVYRPSRPVKWILELSSGTARK